MMPATLIDNIYYLSQFAPWVVFVLLAYIWKNHLHTIGARLERIEKLITDHITWHAEE